MPIRLIVFHIQMILLDLMTPKESCKNQMQLSRNFFTNSFISFDDEYSFDHSNVSSSSEKIGSSSLFSAISTVPHIVSIWYWKNSLFFIARHILLHYTDSQFHYFPYFEISYFEKGSISFLSLSYLSAHLIYHCYPCHDLYHDEIS